MGHILSQVPHTTANEAIIRYFKQEATKNRQPKTSFISTPRQKSQKTLCNKQCKHFRPRCPGLWKECVCLCVWGIWYVSVLVERAVTIYIYKNTLIISLASRCQAFPPPQVSFDNCFLILVLNLVIKNAHKSMWNDTKFDLLVSVFILPPEYRVNLNIK